MFSVNTPFNGGVKSVHQTSFGCLRHCFQISNVQCAAWLTNTFKFIKIQVSDATENSSGDTVLEIRAAPQQWGTVNGATNSKVSILPAVSPWSLLGWL